jgi:hypothetical protein
MISRLTCAGLCLLGLTAGALATGTAALTLSSSVAGQNVAAGAPVDWTIQVTVSAGDNFGLALIACDLAADPNNPALFDIPPGTTIPTVMNGFNRPGGITNPGEGGALSGFIGVQRGTAGQKNLIQIGGAQNTFGQAGTGGMATDPNVDSAIGQAGPQTILSGSFLAPSAQGTYSFSLQNGVVNVLTQVQSPPQFSTVSRATVDVTAASFTFTVGGTTPGDLNCDTVVDFDDINPFVLALSNPEAYALAYPDCNILNGDCNGDSLVDFDDINPFVGLLSGF